MGDAKSGASGASIGSLGLQAAGSIASGYGTKASDEMQSQRATRAAEFGRAQADLTDAVFSERLNTTLGNIDVIRAAGKIDPTSPTTAALEDRTTMLSERQRRATSGSQRAQSEEDAASASYLHKAGNYALNMAYLDAGTKIAAGIAKGGIG